MLYIWNSWDAWEFDSQQFWQLPVIFVFFFQARQFLWIILCQTSVVGAVYITPKEGTLWRSEVGLWTILLTCNQVFLSKLKTTAGGALIPWAWATVAKAIGLILSPPSGMKHKVSRNMRRAIWWETVESAVLNISRNSLNVSTPSWFASPATKSASSSNPWKVMRNLCVSFLNP